MNGLILINNMDKFLQIQIGDSFPSLLNKSLGSDIILTVIEKDYESRLIGLESSFKIEKMTDLIWKKATDELFKQEKII